MKAEPQPTKDAARDSGTVTANGCWLRRLVRPHGHRSTNLLLEPIEIIQNPRLGILWLRACDALNLNCSPAIIRKACIFLLILLPQLQQPVKAISADECLNSKNLWAQLDYRIGINLGSLAVSDMAASMNIGLNSANNGQKIILGLADAIPVVAGDGEDVSAPAQNQTGDQAQEEWADYLQALQPIIYCLGVACGWWLYDGYHKWRARMRSNDQAEP
jgi:hypothetical protein